MCGFNFTASTNIDLYKLYKNTVCEPETYESYIQNHSQDSICIIFNMIKTIDDTYVEKVYELRNPIRETYCESYATQSMHEIKSDLGQKIRKLNLYKQANENLYDNLKTIDFDIYYSDKSNTIFMESDIVKVISKYNNLFQLDNIMDHCIKHKILHINVYILKPELDELITLNTTILEQIINSINTISAKLPLKEGIQPSDVIRDILAKTINTPKLIKISIPYTL